jgi:hypothetical protein
LVNLPFRKVDKLSSWRRQFHQDSSARRRTDRWQLLHGRRDRRGGRRRLDHGRRRNRLTRWLTGKPAYNRDRCRTSCQTLSFPHRRPSSVLAFLGRVYLPHSFQASWLRDDSTPSGNRTVGLDLFAELFPSQSRMFDLKVFRKIKKSSLPSMTFQPNAREAVACIE